MERGTSHTGDAAHQWWVKPVHTSVCPHRCHDDREVPHEGGQTAIVYEDGSRSRSRTRSIRSYRDTGTSASQMAHPREGVLRSQATVLSVQRRNHGPATAWNPLGAVRWPTRFEFAGDHLITEQPRPAGPRRQAPEGSRLADSSMLEEVDRNADDVDATQ
jgi:hypothetical protein